VTVLEQKLALHILFVSIQMVYYLFLFLFVSIQMLLVGRERWGRWGGVREMSTVLSGGYHKISMQERWGGERARV
jgi:hypothetical protein